MRDHAVAALDAVSRADAGDSNGRHALPTDFERLAERAVSRRGFLRGTAAGGATAFVLGAGGMAAMPVRAAVAGLDFTPVAANGLDTVTVPEGYSWHVVARWGDPLWSDGAPFDHATRGTGASQELAFGDNCDGMALYTDGGHSVLAVNNEYTNLGIAFANRESGKPETDDDVRKSKATHGVSVVEIAPADGAWQIVPDSPYNRRITPDTPMEITGPARGHELLKTAADPDGTTALGTWNNCGNGRTPWGTYLACEENFNGYFSSSDPDFALPEGYKRYGIKAEDRGYRWAMTDERFDVSRHPNEPHRAGYIVEIDPLDPASVPKKRTALGRFKHENAEVTLAADGRAVVYLGDDERGEFLYRFVSDGAYSEGGDNADLLASGTLSVARFADDGSGEWVALTPATTGMASQAEICIHTRQAASAVGATTMDRPEWVAANPARAEAYCCLTNNKNRGVKPNAGGDATPVGGPNPRAKNNYGQIVRWRPMGGDHASASFAWDLYVVAGNPTVHANAYAGSANLNAGNMFNSPDGLAFDSQGRLWIQTDGKYSNEGDFAGQGNNMMLVGDPATGEIRRFLVGPRECEVTGITWSGDRTTLFVGIQHPGEKGNSHFPEGGDAAPRSSVIAIARDDGGEIG
ncbi:MAG: PhoX family phosphatase [Rhodospirillales bacterium]|nr:PhoX family phosphatase [Rhodospirillales bacterium]